MRVRNAEFVSQHNIKHITHRARSIEAVEFFNLLTSRELLQMTDELSPQYRQFWRGNPGNPYIHGSARGSD